MNHDAASMNDESKKGLNVLDMIYFNICNLREETKFLFVQETFNCVNH